MEANSKVQENLSGTKLANIKQRNFGRPPDKQLQALQELTRPHIDSFNYVIHEGLHCAAKNISPTEFELPNKQRVGIYILDSELGGPVVSKDNQYAQTMKVYPAECRERGVTYKGRLTVTYQFSVDNQLFPPEERVIGEVPIMVKSDICSLNGLSPEQLIIRKEEAEEMGGYFIINGIEKVIRMLIMPRRNYPTALSRPSWKKRGKFYSEFGISLRSVAEDQTSTTLVLHYLTNGTANISFTYNKEQFFVPVVLIMKCLVNVTDQYIYKELTKGCEEDFYYTGCIANMLRQMQQEGLSSQNDVQHYIGERFRSRLNLPHWKTDEEVAIFLMHKCVCIHLTNNQDKFNLLVYMMKKLFAYAKGQCASESADNPINQEVLLAGHVYLMVLKDKIESWMSSIRTSILQQARKTGVDYQLDRRSFTNALKHTMDLTRQMENFLATGNITSKSGLGLMQASGMAVVADKLNFMRYVSHFRCIHRGAFFSEMRTTAVRKLQPEAWGFLCPVHTPDGAPCGLMNHLSASCQVVNLSRPAPHLPQLLVSLGMLAYQGPPPKLKRCYTVLLDGCVLGWVPDGHAHVFTERLRQLKVQGLHKVPSMMEICFVKKTKVASQYPGIFLFTSRARMMRPVFNLAHEAVEMIGTFEQVYLNICIVPEEAYEGKTTHQELEQCSMLSAIASLTPFSDHNQSPRNMYQCQMGKQTMGSPCQALAHRSDSKLYRLQTPQTPLVRPDKYDYYGVDNYPLGTNAVVAVLSYTGYDMEDAMILNKASYERGFCHGSVYKCEFVNLWESGRRGGNISLPLVFSNPVDHARYVDSLDSDGLPPVGRLLQQGDPMYCYLNTQTGELTVRKYQNQEPAYVDQIKVLGHDAGNKELHKVCFVLRIQRNPIVGDKFSSRHGQKGICSQRWPVHDMPFSESGITPDIIFNPHGFPSRMTIGMMIESMAGKAAAMHGEFYDATPFTFGEDDPAIDYFGQLLTQAGYNYYGTERLYSGVDGREMQADIFVGIVYYQRLRHMVSDKFQVRSTGPVDQVTHQPVKGRKKGGGIRFGEMERDALLAHGTSFLLQDRLLNCSDKSRSPVCVACGSLLSPSMEKPALALAAASYEAQRRMVCRTCNRTDTVEMIDVPYVFRYLVAELGAMNVKVTLDVRPIGHAEVALTEPMEEEDLQNVEIPES